MTTKRIDIDEKNFIIFLYVCVCWLSIMEIVKNERQKAFLGFTFFHDFGANFHRVLLS